MNSSAVVYPGASSSDSAVPWRPRFPCRRSRSADRPRARQGAEAHPGLARVPGLRRQHRVAPARQRADRGRGRPRPPVASTITRRSWPRPASRPRRRCDGRGQGSARASTSRWSRARFRPATTACTARIGGRVGARHRARGVRQRRGHDRGRHVRRVRRLPAAAPNPTGALGRRRCGAGHQEPDQPAGVPGQRRRTSTALLVYYLTFKRLAGARPLQPAAVRLRQVDPRQLRAPRALRRRPVRRGLGRRRAIAPATVSTRWAARARSTFQNCPTSAGTAGPTGRSGAAIRASAAPSRTSGTR